MGNGLQDRAKAASCELLGGELGTQQADAANGLVTVFLGAEYPFLACTGPAVPQLWGNKTGVESSF
jgi:hypothetical protein